ncbi:anaphase-promoting complex subunit 5 [Neocloeon triangulifer]|uniref:anaphase-promoting complex subunit 5 n=1 Tax=Neocloeon triangulifer TaxID=2078957 RepID=UPI00286F9430|nr:anaphase-promoting complex subunit 5 [Neocloeon triangulifer]
MPAPSMDEKATGIDSASQQGDAQKETITPHKIAILTLVKTFGEMKLEVLNKRCSDDDTSPFLSRLGFAMREQSVLNPKYRRTFCMLVLKLLQDPDLTLSQLHLLLLSKQNDIFREFLPEFHKNMLNVMSKGIEGLMSLVKRVSQLLTEPNSVNPIITKSSILGLFIRRSSVVFEQLTCSGVVAVFKVFKRYCEACPAFLNMDWMQAAPDGPPEEEHDEQKTDLTTLKEEKGALWTRRQADLFLAQQSLLLQKNDASIDTKKLHTNIQQLLRANPDCAEAYFLAFLNFLRVRDFPAALHSLHNCFDRGGGLYFDPNSKQLCGNSNDERARSFRYGALNLATLYATFGHKEEALFALKECVMLARSAHCNFCLQHALSWFCKLSDQPGKEKLMECSIARSSEFNLGYLTSLAIQSLSQHVSNQNMSPEKIFELLSQSDILNCQHSLQDLVGNAFAQKASLWIMYGRPAMASLYSQLLLHSEAQDLNPEATCAAVCHLAMQFMAFGDQLTSAVLLSYAREKFPQLDIQPVWMRCEQILGFINFINQGSWQHAKVAAEQLSATDKWESAIRIAELQFAQGDREKSLQGLNSMAKKSVTDKTMPLIVKICSMSLASKLLEVSPFSYSSHLVKALGMAANHNLAPLRYKIILQIAEHQLQMGLVSQALQLINSVMTMVLTHCPLHDQGSFLFFKAKCRIYEGNCRIPSKDSTDHFSILEILGQARQCFEKVQAVAKVKEVLLCMLLLYHLHNLEAEKFKVALELRVFEEQLASRKTSHV